MTRTFKALAIAAALVAVPSFAQAQATLGPQIAYHNDFDFGVGAALTLSADAIHEQVDFLFDFAWFFPEVDGVDYFELNGGLVYDFILDESTVTPFALAGLNVASISVDTPLGGGDNTELGLNLGGGLKFNAGALRPMVGVRLEIEGGDGFVIFGTIPFALQGS
ncbi:MAG: hypothetical protein WD101_03030 [Gemmatimonadota bacterium]